MPINQKILEIQKRLPAIPKEGVGPSSMGSFKFIKFEDIHAATVTLMNELGVIVRTTVLEQQHDYHLAGPAMSMEGKPLGDGRVAAMRAIQRVHVRYDFIDTDDDTVFPVEVWGEAIDIQDKTTRKAMTSARKIAFMDTFQVHDQELLDLDGIDANGPAAPAAEKLDRGAQARKAASPRVSRAAAKPAAAGGALEKAATALSPEEPPAPAAEQSKPAAKEAADAVAETGADAATGEVPESWKPDPEDVAHALGTTGRALQSAVADATQTPAAAPEPSAGPVQHDEDNLDKAKARLRAAVAAAGGLAKEKVDAIGREVTGGKAREAWITSSRDISKIAAKIETDTAEHADEQQAA